MGAFCFFNPRLKTRDLSAGTVQSCLTRTGDTVLGHLRDGHRLRAAAPPQSETAIWFLRLIETVLEEVQSVLPGACSEAQSAQGWRRDHCFPSMVVSTRL